MCYSYKTINTTHTPILNNVDVVLIITMEGSNRFKEDPFLLNLAKKTIIQYNKGFKEGNKPITITNSKQDIVHAYYTAFEYLKCYNNVIILEDDAQVINKDIQIYDKINTFIAVENYNIFSFGSFGLFSKYKNDFLKIDYGVIGAAQAIIYSHNARNKLMEDISSSNFNRGHIDLTYLTSLDRKFTYKYPLIVQLFPKTNNMNIWFNNIFILNICKYLVVLLKLDTCIDSWFLLYFIFRHYILIITLTILLTILLLYNLLYFKISKARFV